MNNNKLMKDEELGLVEEVLTTDYINSLPIMTYEGGITQVKDSETFDKVLDSLSSEKSVGFDTESRPSFTKGKIYPISLIQIATLDHVYIVRFQKTGFTNKFKIFLESDIEKIGVGLLDDLRKLKDEASFKANGILDLSILARSKGHVKSNLRYLCSKYLGKRIVKSSQKTNWARKKLTESQIRYAATDAWVCLLLEPHIDVLDKITELQPDDYAVYQKQTSKS